MKPEEINQVLECILLIKERVSDFELLTKYGIPFKLIKISKEIYNNLKNCN